jgi:antitoxin VapB
MILQIAAPHVYTDKYIRAETAMATTRIFKSGNSQAVRLPKQFQFRGKEVEIFRRGDEVVLREKARGMERAFWLLANMDIDVDAIEEARKELPQSREEM